MGSKLKFAGAIRSRWQSPSAETHPNSDIEIFISLTKIYLTQTIPRDKDVHPNKSCSNYSRHFSSQHLENGPVEGTIYDKAIKSARNHTSEIAFCPVLTYCSILSVFTAIVYMNMAHSFSVKGMRN